MSKILIADDDPDVRECYFDILVSENYQVITASNGKEALIKISLHKPDLLILDITMPKMDGRTALLEIKKLNKDLPIIIASSKVGMASDPEIQLASQVKKFLPKPIDALELIETIRNILTQKSKSLWIGKRLAGCMIQEQIGEGGWGNVYKGKRSGKTIAIKILNNDMHEEENLARFQRETQGLMKIKHPNIIELSDFGITSQGNKYMIMEYFSGEDLQTIIEKESYFSLEKSLDIARQICCGMEVAHSYDLIHRDLKPSNILYNQDNKTLKIIDFGLAKTIQNDNAITHQGYVVGTPYYMSPEQCHGNPLDGRADIYSLGIIMFQMLTGSLPFSGENMVETMFAQIYEPLIWPSKFQATLNPSVLALVEKMTAKNPEERYKSMQEVQTNINAIYMEK